MVRGVRWLGATARIVSFSSERLPNSTTFRNTLLLSDARSRASMPFRCAALLTHVLSLTCQRKASDSCFVTTLNQKVAFGRRDELQCMMLQWSDLGSTL